MKQNETINVLFLFFCILLLGFVYVNTRMNSGFHQKAKTESARSQAAASAIDGVHKEAY